MRNLYTNHGLVLMRIALNPDATLSEIAEDIGVKERAAYLIVRDLVEDGFIEKTKVGRRNSYKVNLDHALDYRPLPHISLREQIIGLAMALGMRPPEEGVRASAGARERATASAR